MAGRKQYGKAAVSHCGIIRQAAVVALPLSGGADKAGSHRREDFDVSETVITVTGMTCEHCVTAVRHEIGGLPGVTGVEVDLRTGAVRITADPPPDPAAVGAAVTAAGYELAG